tara:strand:+ start:381 stop:530 length:150 start_codon:yes stop_codon:yes gene_type:complete
MIDTLKTASVGGGGFVVQFLDMVPELVKVCVGLMTIVYLGMKVYKELKK